MKLSKKGSKTSYCIGLVTISLSIITIISAVLLSIPITNAETITSNASISVGLSCSMSVTPGTGGTATSDGYSYQANVTPGNYTEVDGSIITTTCNGPGDYSLYAIGYSGDSYDTPTNTQMISSTGSNNIVTGTATSGGTSNWAFKLASVSGTATPTIVSPYSNYSNIPGSDFTKVATMTGTTGLASTSAVQAKYRVYASSSQPAGAYTGKVKYTFVYPNDAPAPVPPPHPLASCSTPVPGIAYMQELADSTKKATALSNMVQGSQYYLTDNRDNQNYCVAKQADGNIWMTQNLDLNIGGTGVATLTSENTDLNTSGTAPYVNGYQNSGGVLTWTPDSTAITSGRTISGTTVSGWTDDNNEPYSAEGGDRYYYTTGTTSNETAQTLAQCTAAGHSEEDCAHYHSGNYYNWTVAIASNSSNGIGSTRYAVAANSICPKGWKLPQGRSSTAGDAATRQFGNLWYTSGIITSVSGSSYATDGFIKIRTSPLFFVRGGFVNGSSLNSSGYTGDYWSSSVSSTFNAYDALFNSSTINSAFGSSRNNGLSIRCMVR